MTFGKAFIEELNQATAAHSCIIEEIIRCTRFAPHELSEVRVSLRAYQSRCAVALQANSAHSGRDRKYFRLSALYLIKIIDSRDAAQFLRGLLAQTSIPTKEQEILYTAWCEQLVLLTHKHNLSIRGLHLTERLEPVAYDKAA